MTRSMNESHHIIVLVDPYVRGMSRVADQMEATPTLPSRMAMRQQIDKARQNSEAPVLRVAVVVPATHPELALFAHLLKVDRVALYCPAALPHPSAWLRAIFAVVDLTFASSPEAIRTAIQAGADPDRIETPGPEGMIRLFREPKRKSITKGAFEMATSLLFDATEQTGLLALWERLTPLSLIHI